MSAERTPTSTELSWIASWQPEDEPTTGARQRAEEVGLRAVDPVTGAAIRMFAALTRARHVIELGTGAGVSTLWLLQGLQPDGVLTTIDNDAEHVRLARTSVQEAGAPAGRVRFIAGRALEVLPRLSDEGYDLMLCDAAPDEALDYLTEARRVLRPGGVVLVVGALAGGRVGDPSARDADTLALRELARAVREDEAWVPALLPVGAGLLAAARV